MRVGDKLLILWYTHSFNESISPLRSSGYKSTWEHSSGRISLNAVLKIRMISELSLFTTVSSFLSQSIGTVNLLCINHMSGVGPRRVRSKSISPPIKVGIRLQVQIPDVLESVKWLALCTWKQRIGIIEHPTPRIHARGANSQGFGTGKKSRT